MLAVQECELEGKSSPSIMYRRDGHSLNCQHTLDEKAPMYQRKKKKSLNSTMCKCDCYQ